MRFLIIINILYTFSTSYGSTPINLSMSYQGGYDDNVMRFSKKEISHCVLVYFYRIKYVTNNLHNNHKTN